MLLHSIGSRDFCDSFGAVALKAANDFKFTETVFSHRCKWVAGLVTADLRSRGWIQVMVLMDKTNEGPR